MSRIVAGMVGAGLLVCLAGTAEAQQGKVSKKKLWELLASTKDADRHEAYRLIDGGPNKDMAAAATAFMSKLRKVDIAKHRAREGELFKLLPSLASEAARNGLARELKKWHELRAKAHKHVFDRKLYPSPGPRTVIKGPHTGYRTVKGAMDRSRRVFDKINKQVTTCLTKLGTEKELQERLDALDVFEHLISERKGIIKILAKNPPASFEPQDRTIFTLIKRLWKGEYKEANELYPQLEGPAKDLYFFFYGHALINHNETTAKLGVSKAVLAGLKKLSLMRMSIGILPFQAHKILTDSVRSHLDDMKKRRYFSHFSDDPKREDAQKRAVQFGWKAGVGENLSDAPAVNAIDVWLWDGGHGRIMLESTYQWIGLDWNGGFSGMVVSGKNPEIEYLPRPAFFE